jgi:hypothetical protein
MLQDSASGWIPATDHFSGKPYWRLFVITAVKPLVLICFTPNRFWRPPQKVKRDGLRTALQHWIDQSNDQGRVLEPPEIAAAKGATKSGSDPNAESTPTAK